MCDSFQDACNILMFGFPGLPFWQRMGQAGGAAPPKFLSTHPGSERRAETLKSLIPKAREYAEKYPVPMSSRN